MELTAEDLAGRRLMCSSPTLRFSAARDPRLENLDWAASRPALEVDLSGPCASP